MSSPPGAYEAIAPAPVSITFTVVLIVFFVLGIFSIFYCRACRHNQNVQPGNPADLNAPKGLSPAVIHAFPALVYSNVKHLRKASYELECAICLVEFEDNSILRLLTGCCHVFHQECIDQWLESNKSCPVCRGDLDLSPEEIHKRLPPFHEDNMPGIEEHDDENIQDTFISIDVEDDEEKGVPGSILNGDKCKTGSSNQGAAIATIASIGKLPRWHSTGHSILEKKPAHKYTLKLPDNVRIRRVRGQSGSSANFGSLSARDADSVEESPSQDLPREKVVQYK